MTTALQLFSDVLIYPLLAIFISVVLTYLCIRILPILGYVDKPGGRHIHTKIVPRAGGIAVILAFFIALALFAISANSVETSIARNTLFWRLFWPSALLGTLGMIDDRVELKSWIKLFVQLVVVFIIWYTAKTDYIIFGWNIPWYLSLILTLIWVIIILNAFNLIDGLDGLASGLAVVSASCVAIWFLITHNNNNEAIAMFILAGACLGFLRYNFYPAKIFLGDTGSTFIGLIFAIIGLDSISHTVTATSLLIPLLAIGVPLFDVALAIWRRSVRKLLNPEASGIMDGDQDHLHHRIFRKSQKQSLTALYMYLFACAFAVATISIILLKEFIPAIAFIIVLLAVIVAIRKFANVEIVDSVTLIQNGLRIPRHGIIINLFHPFIDFFIIFVANLVACWIATGSFNNFIYSLASAIPLIVLLIVSGVYNIYWLRVSAQGICKLFGIVFLGSIIYCVITYYTLYPKVSAEFDIVHRDFVAGLLSFMMLTLLLISFERLLIHFAESFWLRIIYLHQKARSSANIQMTRSMIYGGGLSCRFYIQHLYSAHTTRIEEDEMIIGIIDNSSALQNLIVHGYKVRGTIEQLEEVYLKTPFDKLVIAISLVPDEDIATLKRFCTKHNIKLIHTGYAEREL